MVGLQDNNNLRTFYLFKELAIMQAFKSRIGNRTLIDLEEN